MRDTGWFKSSYSGAGTDNCVEVRITEHPGWFKSSFSGANDDNCVEVRLNSHTVSVRDTKNRTAGILTLPGTAWQRFIHAMPSTD
nr:DUF397 domain-containing protein [Kibdelosporangium sp. MJ126-NF4]CEL18898.1 hypothetical protein [Kibdelosporangium sp. MJ126-NF4]CTQ95298.1 hypothetical protein [Kibdelosporangium sp. MJ126-NF4]